ncbi:MAG: NUDIX domain-containing protein [Gammaproteobacteria bacterium]|nr:NUDIX domain-containing protein [Gammaproteobacteria bacterium]
MDNLDPNIRNAVRAMIIRDSRILLIRKEYEDGSQRFALPGGAQDPGETLTTALDRECREEIGTEVRILSLLHVADWFKPRDTVPPSSRHLVEFLFACEVGESYTPQNGYHPDKHQVEVLWVELDRLDTIPLWPQSIAALLSHIQQEKSAVYLGTVD